MDKINPDNKQKFWKDFQNKLVWGNEDFTNVKLEELLVVKESISASTTPNSSRNSSITTTKALHEPTTPQTDQKSTSVEVHRSETSC